MDARHHLAGVLIASLCAAAPAQPQSPSGGAGQPRPVEPGIADLNPLQVSNRLLPIDLRQPTGWERVYRLSGDARGGGEGLFARFDGGITAVFPWSAYQATKRGVEATVPAGTTYYIGGLPSSLLGPGPGPAPQPGDPAFNYVDRSARPAQPERPLMHSETGVDTSLRPAMRYGNAETEPAPGPTIWTSEAYRRQRLEALLTAATGR